MHVGGQLKMVLFELVTFTLTNNNNRIAIDSNLIISVLEGGEWRTIKYGDNDYADVTDTFDEIIEKINANKD